MAGGGAPLGHQQGNQSLGTAGGVRLSPHQDIPSLFLLFFLLFLNIPSPPFLLPRQWEAEKWPPLLRPPLEGMQITKGSPKPPGKGGRCHQREPLSEGAQEPL